MSNEDRENVIHCLKSMIDEEVCEECNLYGTTGIDHCEEDCIRLAIKALQQQPCEDCISRKQIRDVISEWLGCDGYSEGEKNVMKCVLNEINYLPSVQPTRTKESEEKNE